MNTATVYKCFSGAGQTLDSNAANAAVAVRVFSCFLSPPGFRIPYIYLLMISKTTN